MITIKGKVIAYTSQESKRFPRQFKTISIKEAIKKCIALIPRQGKESNKPKAK